MRLIRSKRSVFSGARKLTATTATNADGKSINERFERAGLVRAKPRCHSLLFHPPSSRFFFFFLFAISVERSIDVAIPVLFRKKRRGRSYGKTEIITFGFRAYA